MRQSHSFASLLLLLTLLSSCEFRANLLQENQDAAPIDSASEDASLCGNNDQDRDGITTEIEGTLDIDDDGLGNHQDTDSDADGFPDDIEVGSAPCYPEDTDLDGRPDFIDFDSDGDGLRDEDELAFGTDRLLVDTDGDGQSDAVEYALGTLGNDPTSLTLDAAVSDARPGLQAFSKQTIPEVGQLVHDLRQMSQALTSVAEKLDRGGASSLIGQSKLPDYKPGKGQ